jgi:hypothetical protein
MGIFIGAIIATVILMSVSDQIFAQTNNIVITNNTVTLPAENQTLELKGRSLVTSIIILNSTEDDITAGYVQGSELGTNGLLTVFIRSNSTSQDKGELGNVSYTAIPDGHAVNNSDAGIINLILIFGALGILVFVIVMIFSGSMREFMMKRFRR